MAGHPEWYLNLLAYEAEPEAPHLEPPEVEVAGRPPVTVRTTVVDGDDRERWWKRLVSVYPRFERVPGARRRTGSSPSSASHPVV